MDETLIGPSNFLFEGFWERVLRWNRSGSLLGAEVSLNFYGVWDPQRQVLTYMMYIEVQLYKIWKNVN